MPLFLQNPPSDGPARIDALLLEEVRRAHGSGKRVFGLCGAPAGVPACDVLIRGGRPHRGPARHRDGG